MNWFELKNRIINLLLSRDLANPNIRINALSRLEGILKTHFNDIYNNPSLLLKIDKNDFKEKISKYKKLNSAESSVINNFYQILETDVPHKANSKIKSQPKVKRKSKSEKPVIVSTCEELTNPIFGLAPIVDTKTKILILGTFPAKQSIDANFYYQNQIKRFWGQALDYFGIFENISNKERKKLLFEKRIGLWDIFHCVIREGSNQDKAIEKAKYNDIVKLLDDYINIKYLIFNGKNAYIWLKEDIPSIFDRNDLSVRRLQSSSGGNGWFNEGKDWKEYFEETEF